MDMKIVKDVKVMKKSFVFFFMSFIAFMCFMSAFPITQDAVVGWLRDRAIPLQTVEAGRGFADLQPLKKIIGDARIVALGEATHGTREFFQLKHRMLEFLATEMGFTIFSIEANMPEAYRVNDYVLTGVGDPAALLRGMYFWTWDTEEVLDMIRWMRRFNETGKGKLEFTGFDMQTAVVAIRIVQEFVASRDPSLSSRVADAAELAKVGAGSAGPQFGVATGTFPLEAAAGKRVRFSGYIRTEGITHGYAGLWWRVDGKNGTLAFDNMAKRGVTGTSDWKRHDIELAVPADATNINFGAILTGDGAAWFDDWTVELDGAPYADTNRFDFQFESPEPKGFFTAGNGYGVGIDSATFRSGKQSLHMRSVAAASAAPPRVNALPAVAAWTALVSDLERNRTTYRSAGATDRDIDWAIQNARVVLQGLQMRAGTVSRDKSMAENVKWILDHSPNAKIVLWAHNGHVASGRIRIRDDGADASKDVRQRDGGRRLRLQPGRVPGDGAGKGPDDVHGAAGAGRQPRRHARGHGSADARGRSSRRAHDRAGRGVARTAARVADDRRGLLRGDRVRTTSWASERATRST